MFIYFVFRDFYGDLSDFRSDDLEMTVEILEISISKSADKRKVSNNVSLNYDDIRDKNLT